MSTNKQIKNDLNNYHWFNEPDKVSIKLDENFRKIIVNHVLKNSTSMTGLANQTQLSKQTLFNYIYGKSMNIVGLKKLLDFLDKDYDYVKGHIVEIACSDIKLPVQLNCKESAIVFAAILGDGSNTTRVMYKNSELTLIKRVEESVLRWLGPVTIDYRISQKNIPYLMLPRILGRILTYAGIPEGKQSLNNPGVPNSIIHSDIEVKKVFIQHFFDDEGWPEQNQMKIGLSQCVDCTKVIPTSFREKSKEQEVLYLNQIPADIKNKIFPPNLLIDIRKILLEDFFIHSNLRLKRILNRINHVTAAFELEIQQQNSVKLFEKRINFFHPSKRQKLHFMIHRNRDYPKDIMLLILNATIKISNDKGYFFAHDIAKELNFPQPPIRKRINTLKNMGIFSKVDSKFYVNVNL